MIKANELRIGNKVIKGKRLCEIASISGIKYSFNQQDSDLYFYDKKKIERHLVSSIEPIPLTEEWLLKFGFEINETYCSKKINKTNEFNIMFFDDGWLLCDCDIHCKIKYVHQLQNLFWCLCNEELTIKN